MFLLWLDGLSYQLGAAFERSTSTMDDPVIRQYHAALTQGINAFNEGNQPEALNQFERALSYIDRIQDVERRRSEIRQTALLLVKGRLGQIGRMLAQRAVQLDEQVGNQRHLGQDLLTLGWAEMQLGMLDEAEKSYNRALQVAERNGDHDTAAGALTNLAILLGARGLNDPGSLRKAIQLLRRSLECLARREKGEFEIITRIALVQALVAAGEDPDAIFPVARTLFDRFAKELRDDQWKGTLGPLREAVQRYLRAHPATDAHEWTRKRFPELLQTRAAS
jgi:tetratricopeptide (TPR) repeat protein